MSIIIVPNELRDAINKKLDEAIVTCTEKITTENREFFYRELLAYFDEHGIIPDFSLVKKDI